MLLRLPFPFAISLSLSLILSDHLLILSVVCMVVVLPGVLLDSLGMSMWEETEKEWKKSDPGRYTHSCPFGHVCWDVYVWCKWNRFVAIRTKDSL